MQLIDFEELSENELSTVTSFLQDCLDSVGRLTVEYSGSYPALRKYFEYYSKFVERDFTKTETLARKRGSAK